MSYFHKVAVIGNFPPRQCGIATFTADLIRSLTTSGRITSPFALAMNDTTCGYEYGKEVHFEISQARLDDYHHAADFLNIQGVDAISVQHEFGIFGGVAGSHLLTLLDEVDAPIVTTLHTILEYPDAAQRAVMTALAQRSDRLVVMSRTGERFLRSVYDVAEDKIVLIPHGIPDVEFTETGLHKARFGVEDKTVLLTFGLLSPNKGLEQAIRALPQILALHPEVVYFVLGATHPHLLKHEGEAYRRSLQELARSLGVEDHVIFFDQFVELQDLLAFIGAADVYLTPYGNREQIVSGTLAYALGAGKAIVSTPYWYAEELLADGRGVLTPFNDVEALGQSVLSVLENKERTREMRARAYAYGRTMVWSEVATRYLETFEDARAAHLRSVPILSSGKVQT